MEDIRLRQREYLLQISRAMTSRLDLPALLRLSLEFAVEMLRGQVGLIALRQEDGAFWIAASYGLGPKLVPLLAPLLRDIPPMAGPAGAGRWTIPGLEVKLSLVSPLIGMDLRQVVALPLVMEDDFIGVIYVFRTRGSAFSANDRAVLSSFADQAAIAVHNARLYGRLAEERQLLSTIIEGSADGVMIVDPDCRIQVFNRALSAMSGWSADDALGQPCSRVLALRNPQGVDLCATSCPLREGDLDHYLYGAARR